MLVLGGEAGPSRRAWVFRPSLVGPASGSVTAVPANAASTGVLTPTDPNTADAHRRRGGSLTAPAEDTRLAARALVGGPRMQRGSVRATLDGEGRRASR
ncbi:MAG: hypothetical protein KIT31_22430 [Deltaproteobacteria bacterium]|nr:hypothetical protein [Deltaproteobacteria bacterium]